MVNPRIELLSVASPPKPISASQIIQAVRYKHYEGKVNKPCQTGHAVPFYFYAHLVASAPHNSLPLPQLFILSHRLRPQAVPSSRYTLQVRSWYFCCDRNEPLCEKLRRNTSPTCLTRSLGSSAVPPSSTFLRPNIRSSASFLEIPYWTISSDTYPPEYSPAKDSKNPMNPINTTHHHRCS